VSEAPQRKVAIVDDDAAVRDSLRLLLEVMGYAVVAFESAAVFLNTAMHNAACLISDYQMPGMTGLELAEEMRANGSVIPILLTTGSATPALFVKAAELGIKVLEKPFDEDDLLDFIRSILG